MKRQRRERDKFLARKCHRTTSSVILLTTTTTVDHAHIHTNKQTNADHEPYSKICCSCLFSLVRQCFHSLLKLLIIYKFTTPDYIFTLHSTHQAHLLHTHTYLVHWNASSNQDRDQLTLPLRATSVLLRQSCMIIFYLLFISLSLSSTPISSSKTDSQSAASHLFLSSYKLLRFSSFLSLSHSLFLRPKYVDKKLSVPIACWNMKSVNL